MICRSLLSAATIGAVIAPRVPSSAQTQVGDFAPDPAFTWSYAGGRAEVALWCLMPPDLLAGRLPAGFAPRTPRALATESPDSDRSWPSIRRRPTTCCPSCLSAGSTALPSPGAAAPGDFRVLAVLGRAGDSARVLDPRARDGSEVDFGQWTSDTALARRLRAVRPAVVGTTAPTAARAPDGTWRLRIATTDATVDITYRPLGAPHALDPPATVGMGTHWPAGAGAPRASLVLASGWVG